MKITDFLGQNLVIGDKVVYPVATSTSGRCLALAEIVGFKQQMNGIFAIIQDIRSNYYMRHNPHNVRVDKLAKVSV